MSESEARTLVVQWCVQWLKKDVVLSLLEDCSPIGVTKKACVKENIPSKDDINPIQQTAPKSVYSFFMSKKKKLLARGLFHLLNSWTNYVKLNAKSVCSPGYHSQKKMILPCKRRWLCYDVKLWPSHGAKVEAKAQKDGWSHAQVALLIGGLATFKIDNSVCAAAI